jgi:hypothetical protein
MTTLSSTSKPARATSRRPVTLEMVRLACPDSAQARRISTSFGLAIVDGDGIRALHRIHLIDTAAALNEGMMDMAMQIHMQRVVGAFVGSAHGAGQFYSRSVTVARDLTARLSNDDRNEDVAGPAGFDSRAQRRREFAAQVGLQAHMLRMAAEGAVLAYEQVTGNVWKPFDPRPEPSGASLDKRAAGLQMAALD